MIPEALVGIGSKALRLFRLFGRLEFIKRLNDFLVHEGRRSRAQVVEQTAKAVLELEKAESLRLQNTKTLLSLMKAAGFSEEKIQAALSSPQEMQRVSIALTTLLQYVDRGVVTLTVVEGKESSQKGTFLEESLQQKKLRTSKRSRPRKEITKK